MPQKKIIHGAFKPCHAFLSYGASYLCCCSPLITEGEDHVAKEKAVQEAWLAKLLCPGMQPCTLFALLNVFMYSR